MSFVVAYCKDAAIDSGANRICKNALVSRWLVTSSSAAVRAPAYTFVGRTQHQGSPPLLTTQSAYCIMHPSDGAGSSRHAVE